jgi:hypothetical protein
MRIFSPNGFFSQVVKIFQWIPLLWRDFDYDHMFLLKIMRYKIQRMRKYQEKHSVVECPEVMIDEMKEAERLLTNLIEENYEDSEEKALFEKKYGKITRWLDKTDNPSLLKVRTEPFDSNPEAKNAWWKIIEKENERYLLDRIQLFNFLQEKIWGWWD